MYNYELSDEARQKLVEAAAWAKAGLKITEESGTEQKAQKRLKQLKESNEEYLEEGEDCETCPVCLSQLEEPLSESRLVEHLNIVLGLIDRLQTINESEEEDLETVVAEVIEENLIEEDDEDEDEYEDEDEDEDEEDEDLEEEEG